MVFLANWCNKESVDGRCPDVNCARGCQYKNERVFLTPSGETLTVSDRGEQ